MGKVNNWRVWESSLANIVDKFSEGILCLIYLNIINCHLWDGHVQVNHEYELPQGDALADGLELIRNLSI